MKKLFILLSLITFIHTKSIAQTNVNFVMSRLWCDQTTEAGEDEIYLKVIAKMSNGGTLNNQQPNDHWDMNDGNEPRNVDNTTLLITPLKAGESGTIIVIVCEQDGGGSEKWQKIGEAVLSVCDDPRCIAAQQISYWSRKLGLTIQDTDDYIGSFTIDFGFNNDGSFWSKRGNLERYCSEEKWGDNGFKIQLCGDGSNYTGWFSFGSSD